MQYWLLPIVVMLASISATWATLGVPFIASEVYGLTVRQNLWIACAQGVVYAIGASMAQRASGLLGRKGTLMAAHPVLAATLVAMWMHPPAGGFVALLLFYTLVLAVTWPLTSSWHCQGAAGAELAGRVQVYNMCWAATGALAIAVQGSLGGAGNVLILAAVLHGLAGAVVGLKSVEATVTKVADGVVAAVQPVRQSTGLILARCGLPASYMVIYTLSAVLEANATLKSLGDSGHTLGASVWLVVRAVTFLLLGRFTFWSHKPGVLIWGMVAMGVSFVVLTLGLDGAAFGLRMGVLLAAQVVLGATLGLIYTASLYFGMAVSSSDSRQGGYHEALIGVGFVLGPGATAALMGVGLSVFWPVVVITAGCTAGAGWVWWRRGGGVGSSYLEVGRARRTAHDSKRSGDVGRHR